MRAAALSLAVGAMAGALTSCGTKDRTVSYSGGTLEKVTPENERRGKEISVEAMGLFKDVESLRLGVDKTSPQGRQKVSLHMDRDSNCTGTFDAGPAQRGDLIMIEGQATYVRFSDESLQEIRELAVRRGPEIAARARERTALARGKYLKIPTGGAVGGPSMPVDSCDLDKITGQMPGGPGPDDVIKAQGQTRRYGEDVIPLVEHGNGETTVYVAAHGKPYVLGLEAEENGQTMRMRMSDYDEPVEAVAPAAAQTIDISEVSGSTGGGSLFEV
ncbi:hypothetical protein [Streptomyces kanamyceticus]|uniref:Lipoprotein n=1 Tax=Streptomyces kanamyceticus TaxID=1967 RepID=A0A5J6GB89_STRKN|nr:hypothetical protein [Streptomyces kanamyceticus]QEU92277.1 hypothetical protein CP970_16385 [Streptomyces kanamyceticus]